MLIKTYAAYYNDIARERERDYINVQPFESKPYHLCNVPSLWHRHASLKSQQIFCHDCATDLPTHISTVQILPSVSSQSHDIQGHLLFNKNSIRSVISQAFTHSKSEWYDASFPCQISSHPRTHTVHINSQNISDEKDLFFHFVVVTNTAN